MLNLDRKNCNHLVRMRKSCQKLQIASQGSHKKVSWTLLRSSVRWIFVRVVAKVVNQKETKQSNKSFEQKCNGSVMEYQDPLHYKGCFKVWNEGNFSVHYNVVLKTKWFFLPTCCMDCPLNKVLVVLICWSWFLHICTIIRYFCCKTT